MHNDTEFLIENTTPEDTDAEALARFVAGDQQGLAALVDRHNRSLIRVAWRVLGNEADARDAVQDAWCAVVRNADTYRGESTVSTWLHRIVHNHCLNALRRRVRRPQTVSDEATGAAGATEVADLLTSLAHRQTETRIVVDELLAALSPEHREATVLVDLCGLSVAEAARVVGASEGTIKSRRARARFIMAAHAREARLSWID